jgi:hypothetical protein
MNPRAIAKYLLEFTPIAHLGTPTKPCQYCGDRVFYRLKPGAPWFCRTCRPSGNAGWWMADCWHYPRCEPPQHVRSAIDRWFVVPPGSRP